MDTSFDLVALLKQQPSTKKSHKIRPTQFVSVAGGVKKRLESNIKDRRSSRLSVFDRIRNITRCESPKAPNLSNAHQKELFRRQQLEKWKEEKDKKKKEAAAQKKKPFVAAVSQRIFFGPPPSPPRPMPSISGRVTRSQARRNTEQQPSNAQTESFAPSNATFKPLLFLGTDVPTLAPVNKKKARKAKPKITFEPVLPKHLQKKTKNTQTTRAKRATNIPIVDNKKKPNEKTKSKMPVKPPPLKQQMFQSSSSSSDVEQPSKQRRKPQYITKTQEIPEAPAPMIPGSPSQDSVCVLDETASMSSQESQDASMPSQDGISTPRNKVPKSESSSEEKLRSPRAVDNLLTPEQIAEAVKNISPCVTMSRGKKNARKEMKKKIEEGLLDEDNSNMESLNHFRQQLNSEVARITAMCDTWDQIFSQTVLPEPIQESVLAAVGQARLLMSQKLQQFAGLVESCAHPVPGAVRITPADLHGFWDMVFMQVENIDMRFKNLEELRLRDWIEEPKPVAKKVVAKTAAKKVVAKPAAKKAVAKPTGGSSELMKIMAEARKAKKAEESQSETSASEPAASSETKTFDAGFFRISSPMKQGSPAPSTPSNNKTSLLKSVLSSEAKKSLSKNSTSFAMLRASLMSKNVDIEGVSPLLTTPTVTPVDLCATPARSILKQNPVSSRKPDKPKTVLFHDLPATPPPAEAPAQAAEPPAHPATPPPAEAPAQAAEPPAHPATPPAAAAPAYPAPPPDDKENSATPGQASTRRLTRQNAVQSSPVMTRSRRKSAQTPLVESATNVENKRSSRQKEAQAHATETPKRSTRRRKSAAAV